MYDVILLVVVVILGELCLLMAADECVEQSGGTEDTLRQLINELLNQSYQHKKVHFNIFYF